jgi:hypothetical protein
MKIIRVFILFFGISILVVTNLNAAVSVPVTKSQTVIHSEKPDKELCVIKWQGKYGYIRLDGTIAIPPLFDDAHNFASNGLASVNSNGKWGYIRANGGFAIPPQFNEAGNFAPNGLAAVSVHFESRGESGYRYGFIKADGSFMILPKFDKAGEFASNGLAPVQLGNKWGYIKEDGSFAISPRFNGAGNFASNGLAAVEVPVGPYTHTSRYIIANGSYAFEENFATAGQFAVNGLAAVSKMGRRGYDFGYIKADGTIAIPMIYDHAGTFASNGIALVQKGASGYYIRSDGSRLNDKSYSHYDSSGYNENGLAFTTKADEKAFIDGSGAVVLRFGEYKCPKTSVIISAWMQNSGRIILPLSSQGPCNSAAREKIEKQEQIAMACNRYYPGYVGRLKRRGWLMTSDNFIVRYVNPKHHSVTIEGTSGGNSLSRGAIVEYDCSTLNEFEGNAK